MCVYVHSFLFESVIFTKLYFNFLYLGSFQLVTICRLDCEQSVCRPAVQKTSTIVPEAGEVGKVSAQRSFPYTLLVYTSARKFLYTSSLNKVPLHIRSDDSTLQMTSARSNGLLLLLRLPARKQKTFLFRSTVALTTTLDKRYLLYIHLGSFKLLTKIGKTD